MLCEATRFKPAQVFQVAFEVFDAVGVIVDVSRLQKAIELKSGQSQKLGCLMMRQRAGTLALNSQGL
jgi:hypothetical protein